MPCQVPSAISPASTGICSEVAVSMVLICAGMSSGPSVSCTQPPSSGASRRSAVSRSTSTDGSAFSWMVSEAEVWRMNSVSAPSCAPALRRNFAASCVMSEKPVPRVSRESSAETILPALTADGAESDDAVGRLMRGNSNPAPDILLHTVGHLDQPPPGFLEEGHHAVHVAVTRQRDFDLALALSDLRLRLFQR